MESLRETREQLRKRHLLMRNEMEEEERIHLSKIISGNAKKILKIPDNMGMEVKVYGYYPLGSEVSLIPFYEFLLEKGIPLAFPRVDGISMDFYQVFSLNHFKEGAFHVKEPDKSCKKAEWEYALCLTPGLVFDRTGSRFGYGKGYYDHYFEKYPHILRAGIAYEHQIEEKLPMEPWDLPMHYLITEQGISCGKETIWN
ncbi:MAG: 5-formyltetrahydrofolate cyclo-ligase [Roseburia sp.]|nr:5-formyltetrahydrofolate cyclo-ligase [Roseburia sp.]